MTPERNADTEQLRDAFLAGAAAQESLEHCARHGIHYRLESYFEEFLAEREDGRDGVS